MGTRGGEGGEGGGREWKGEGRGMRGGKGRKDGDKWVEKEKWEGGGRSSNYILVLMSEQSFPNIHSLFQWRCQIARRQK